MASREADDLASVANRAEERLKALESTVFKEREELRAKLAELEAENAKLRYRVERLGAALKEGTTAAKKALEEAGESSGGDQGLRSRLGRILFGKYFIEEQE